MRRSTLLGAVLVSMLCSLGLASVSSGQRPDRPAGKYVLFNLLMGVDYDATRNGPLLDVDGGEDYQINVIMQSHTLADRAAVSGRKVIHVGGLTILAPEMMQIIVDRPGTADPYAKLKAMDRFRLLLSLFTEDQWKTAGSAAGIGLSDLNASERQLFTGLLPGDITLQQNLVVAGDDPNTTRSEPTGDPQQETSDSAHLRLSRTVTFGFAKVGGDGIAVGGSVDPEPGDKVERVIEGGREPDAANDPPGTVTAFGQTILKMVPNALKPEQLDFRAQQLNAAVPLDGDFKTLGDLVGRVAHITGLDIVADKRVAVRQLAWRVAPGQSARAGDILEALCWSVTGAFRRVGPSTYILTDDIQGIGTRFGRLNDWAEPARNAFDNALNDLAKKTARNKPLSHIGFAPGDPNALPPPILNRVDDAYISGEITPMVAASDLSESLQRQIDRNVANWGENNAPLQTDRVHVGTALAVNFVFPDGRAVEAPFFNEIGGQFLRSNLTFQVFAAPAPNRSAPKPMPATLHKRVVVAQLPTLDGSVNYLLSLAKSKGFTEVWFEVKLNDPQAPPRMKSAIRAGDRIGISVGCAASVLRDGGVPAAEDVNVLGETGQAFDRRRSANWPEEREDNKVYDGWTVLDPDQVARLLEPLAEIHGLCAFALKDTAAPGWGGQVDGGDGINYNDDLGYTVDTRLLCIHEEGFDPIDTYQHSYALDLDANLQFFPSGEPNGVWRAFEDFRLHENKRRMARLHAAVRRVAPTLPLYLDDRTSPYSNNVRIRWYGRWADAKVVPRNPLFSSDSESREAAFASSPEPIRTYYGHTGRPELGARGFGTVAQDAAKHWRGAALDLTRITPAASIAILEALPHSPEPAK